MNSCDRTSGAIFAVIFGFFGIGCPTVRSYQRTFELLQKRLHNVSVLQVKLVTLKGWSTEFGLALPERKKMIIGRLIDRIEIGKGYDITIKMNMNSEQFS